MHAATTMAGHIGFLALTGSGEEFYQLRWAVGRATSRRFSIGEIVGKASQPRGCLVRWRPIGDNLLITARARTSRSSTLTEGLGRSFQ